MSDMHDNAVSEIRQLHANCSVSKVVPVVLRTLAGYPESGKREHGCYWSPEELRALADELEGGGRS